MAQKHEKMAMIKDFSALSEENKKKVLDMTKFLVLTQNTIVPAMLQTGEQEAQRQFRAG